MNKFEYRFEGPSNAGLRAEIRRVVCDNLEASPLEIEQKIMNISRRVALNLSGFRTLALVASDYYSARSFEQGRIDCWGGGGLKFYRTPSGEIRTPIGAPSGEGLDPVAYCNGWEEEGAKRND